MNRDDCLDNEAMAAAALAKLPVKGSIAHGRDTCDYDKLDPGIRDTVRLLRAHGFETTDSGDGQSKGGDYDEAEYLPFPHVFSVVQSADFLFAEAMRMRRALGDPWIIEASYCPNDESSLILARREL